MTAGNAGCTCAGMGLHVSGGRRIPAALDLMDKPLKDFLFSDSTPLVVLKTTTDGVKQVEFNGAHAAYSNLFQGIERLALPVGHSPRIRRIELIYSEEEIIFRDNYKSLYT